MGAAGSINMTSNPVTAETVQQIVDCLATLSPDLLTIVSTAIRKNPNAISNLNKMGFIQEAEHVAAKLPPELRSFSIIKEEETVAAALTNPAFVAAQQAMQSTPNDPNVLTALQVEITKVMPIYNTAIQTRLKEVDLKSTCRKVIYAGNEDFEGVYQNVWDITNKSDEEGCEATKKPLPALSFQKHL
jgi:hypothetical protein